MQEFQDPNNINNYPLNLVILPRVVIFVQEQQDLDVAYNCPDKLPDNTPIFLYQ